MKVTGKAGCGKSDAIYSIVNHCVTNNAKVLIAALTGFLASIFSNNVPHDIDCETVCASFRINKLPYPSNRINKLIVDTIFRINNHFA